MHYLQFPSPPEVLDQMSFTAILQAMLEIPLALNSHQTNGPVVGSVLGKNILSVNRFEF